MPSESAYFIATPVGRQPDMYAVKKELDTLHGVTSVSVCPKNSLICVDYDSSGASYDRIENSLNKMGYQIAADASEIHTR